MKRTIIDASQLELEDNVVTIKRVTKVVKGGRNMKFTALVVVGDKNGHVGVGLGKATEIPEAIRKGKEDAIKKLVEVPIDENGSVPHDLTGKFGSACSNCPAISSRVQALSRQPCSAALSSVTIHAALPCQETTRLKVITRRCLSFCSCCASQVFPLPASPNK